FQWQGHWRCLCRGDRAGGPAAHGHSAAAIPADQRETSCVLGPVDRPWIRRTGSIRPAPFWLILSPIFPGRRRPLALLVGIRRSPLFNSTHQENPLHAASSFRLSLVGA